MLSELNCGTVLPELNCGTVLPDVVSLNWPIAPGFATVMISPNKHSL